MFVVISDTGAISTGTPTLQRATDFAAKYRAKKDGDGRYVAIMEVNPGQAEIVGSWEHDGKAWREITPRASNAATP